MDRCTYPSRWDAQFYLSLYLRLNNAEKPTLNYLIKDSTADVNPYRGVLEKNEHSTQLPSNHLKLFEKR